MNSTTQTTKIYPKNKSRLSFNNCVHFHKKSKTSVLMPWSTQDNQVNVNQSGHNINKILSSNRLPWHTHESMNLSNKTNNKISIKIISKYDNIKSLTNLHQKPTGNDTYLLTSANITTRPGYFSQGKTSIEEENKESQPNNKNKISCHLSNYSLKTEENNNSKINKIYLKTPSMGKGTTATTMNSIGMSKSIKNVESIEELYIMRVQCNQKCKALCKNIEECDEEARMIAGANNNSNLTVIKVKEEYL